MFSPLFNKLTLSFYIRSRKSEGQTMLYARLALNGKRTTEYRVGVYVPIEAWERKTQSVREPYPQAQRITLLLAQIRAQHEQLFIALQLQHGADVSASAIRQRWQEENAPKLSDKPSLDKPDPLVTLLAIYSAYLTHIVTRPKEDRKAEKTRASYRMAGVHLKAFLAKKKQPHLLAEKVTPGFGMQLYDYLRERNINADTANRYLNFIKAALHHALLYDRIATNGLFQFKPPRGNPAKRIVFLSESALAELEGLPLIGIRDTVRKWALFMCHTGLDYKDAVTVVKNERAFRMHTDDGDKWVYQRLKMRHAPVWGECHIPILLRAQQLLPELIGGKRPQLKVINTHLKEIAQKLRLPFDFCSKVCRKTAGVIFLKEGYSMQSIQKILGHQSLSMTERHYLSIQSFVVDKDMAKIRASQFMNTNPFSQIHKTA